MDLYALLRFAKVLAVATLFAGTIGSFLTRDLADRRRYAYWLAGPAFGVTWGVGFGLASTTSASLLSTWILVGMGLSFFSLQVVLYAVGKEGRRTSWAALLAIAPLVATAALMVTRPA